MNKGLNTSGYKRTTDKQYSLLTHEMSRFSAQNYEGKSKLALKYWNILTEKLNAMGPPFRTVSQWKKVWTDYRRFHSRKTLKHQPKLMQIAKEEPGSKSQDSYRVDKEGEENAQTGYRTSTTNKSRVADYLRSESDEYERYDSMHSTLSNDFVDEYSYPDRNTQQQHQETKKETLIPDETNYDSLNYTHEIEDEDEMLQMNDETSNANLMNAARHRSPPPLQPANTRLIDQTLYTLQNQFEQQSKLLEHISQISSTMATLMERQVKAIEQQTEAIRRQASATEHHTLVMNNFVDMIREKMPRVNSKTNLSNGNL